ncbi:short-chain dehydrogenase/reductase [Kaistia algarum]|uniref:oxidoreductase n=1 Tax=Kaistia algarum TaxID=2083279 RepID=UPI000CE81E03|nr:oxidoreductase [Kaistia algarum]MCX5516048.1 oxidoreductase [Kaistia algarum]PPE77975.1 short-chain dehydrogenase/reductase [Kaistia algarum]
MSRIWFVTGATRGIGAEIVKAALGAGDSVVATGRSAEKVRSAFADAGDALLALPLDVTDGAQIAAAVDAALAHFGRIDVLVNNAGYGQLGLFEETDPEDAERQFATNVFGVFDVTRAVLPAMRRQRSGHILNITSVGGIRTAPSGSLYSASKFAVEGFSEALAQEVEAFGIAVTIVGPGSFRTDFLDQRSIRFARNSIDDYAGISSQIRARFEGRNGQQAGDPAKLGKVIVDLVKLSKPPIRFSAGSDAVQMVAEKIERLRTELQEYRDLSISTDGDYASVARIA